jgi:predicted Rdx family selenoprotein
MAVDLGEYQIRVEEVRLEPADRQAGQADALADWCRVEDRVDHHQRLGHE